MSDAGNVNGDVIDDPDPNSTVVGVDIISGDGNDPDTGDPDTGDGDDGGGDGGGLFDPSAHTVDEVNAYLADHPDDTDRVLEAERAGKNRTGVTGG